MIPYTDEKGLRNYRAPVVMSEPHAQRRWPWLVAGFVVGLLTGAIAWR